MQWLYLSISGLSDQSKKKETKCFITFEISSIHKEVEIKRNRNLRIYLERFEIAEIETGELKER